MVHNDRPFPFKGKVRMGMGRAWPASLGLPHPHLNPPLEGEEMFFCVDRRPSTNAVYLLPEHFSGNQGHAIVGHVKTLFVLSPIVTDFQAIGNARAFIDHDFA